MHKGEEDEISIKDAAYLVAKAMNYPQERIKVCLYIYICSCVLSFKIITTTQFDTTKADGQYKKTASNEKLMRLLRETNSDFAFTPLEEGILLL